MTHGLADYFTMFVSNFVLVFLLGLQSKNVNAGRYMAAVTTSFGISVANFIFVKYAAAGSYDVSRCALPAAVPALRSPSGSTSISWKNDIMAKENNNAGTPVIVKINQKVGNNGSSFDISKTKVPLNGSGPTPLPAFTKEEKK